MTATPTAELPAVQRQRVLDPPLAVEQLVLQTSFLGDAVLTTPLITELAMRGPVDVLTTPAAAPVLANNPHIRAIHIYDKRGADAGATGLHRVAQRLRDAMRGRLATRSIAYLAQGSLRTAALAALAGYDDRVGFGDAAGRFFYTMRVERRNDRHHAERLWRLAFPSNPNVEPPEGALRPRLYPGAADHAAVDAVLGAWAHEPIIALAPGSVWGTKRWPYYSMLASRLSKRHRLVVVGGPDDKALAAEILAAAEPDMALDATGRLSLLAFERIDPARAAARDQRFLAAAFGERDEHADDHDLRTHSAGLRLRPPRAAFADRREQGSSLPPLSPPRPADVSTHALEMHEGIAGGASRADGESTPSLD